MTTPYIPQKVSILDRLTARLFPSTQLLDPGTAQQVGRQGLLQLGANLLQAGGPQAAQRGTLANIGAAIGSVDLNDVTRNALALQAYQRQVAAQQRIGQVIAGNPAQPNETTTQTHDRLVHLVGQLAGIPEALPILEKLGPIIAATKPEKPERPSTATRLGLVDPRTGRAVLPGQGGVPAWVTIDDVTGQQVGRATAGGYTPPKEPTPVERVAGSQYESAVQSVGNMEAIYARNPAAAKAAVAAVRAGGWGKLGQAYSELRGFTNDPDAQQFYTEFNNALLSFSPIYGGTRTTQQILTLEKAAVLPALGSGDFAAAFRHLHNRLQDLRAKAGRAAPPSSGGGRYSPDNPFR